MSNKLLTDNLVRIWKINSIENVKPSEHVHAQVHTDNTFEESPLSQ